MAHRTIPRILYDYFVDHWIVSAIIATAPAYWFTFIEIWGTSVGLVVDGKLTPFANIIFYPLFIVSALFAIVMSLADKYNEKSKRDGQYVLGKMLDGVNSVKHAKLRRFIDYINRHHGEHNLSPFHEITQPTVQLESILLEIQDVFSDIFGISKNAIGLSIICKTDESFQWKQLRTINTDNDLTMEEVLSYPNSTVWNMINSKQTSILFFPDKRVGEKEGKYFMGPKDRANGGIGSIICRDISLETERKCIDAILSISTYGSQICSVDDLEAIQKVQRILLPPFERRIQLELALIYIKDVMAKAVP